MGLNISEIFLNGVVGGEAAIPGGRTAAVVGDGLSHQYAGFARCKFNGFPPRPIDDVFKTSDRFLAAVLGAFIPLDVIGAFGWCSSRPATST